MNGFRMNLDAAEEFFRRCERRKASTEPQRVAILQELVAELRAVRLNEKDIRNQLRGKKALHIKAKRTTHNAN